MTDFTGGTWRSLVDGADVFAIPDNVIDNFDDALYEDKNLTISDRYGGDLSAYTRQTSTVDNGTHALEATATTAGNLISDTDSERVTISQGDKFAAKIRWPSGGNDGGILFGTNSENDPSGYHVGLGGNGFRLATVSSGSFGATLDQTAFNDSNFTSEWLKIVVDWATDGTITATLNDSSGSQQATVSKTDATYSSGGIGFRIYDGTLYFDNLERI